MNRSSGLGLALDRHRSAPGPPTSWSGGSKGFYPQEDNGGQRDRRSLRAGDRQAGRARLYPEDELPAKLEAALEAGRPPDFAFGVLFQDYIGEWAVEDRLVDLSDAIGSLREPVRSGCARRVDLLDAQTGQKAPVRAAVGPLDQPRPRLEEPLAASGVHARRHSARVGCVLVVLVRPGPAGRAPGPGPRRHLGRRLADVGRLATPTSSSISSCRPTGRTTSPATAS